MISNTTLLLEPAAPSRGPSFTDGTTGRTEDVHAPFFTTPTLRLLQVSCGLSASDIARLAADESLAD